MYIKYNYLFFNKNDRKVNRENVAHSKILCKLSAQVENAMCLFSKFDCLSPLSINEFSQLFMGGQQNCTTNIRMVNKAQGER